MPKPAPSLRTTTGRFLPNIADRGAAETTLEANHHIVQRLTVAGLALDLGQLEASRRAVREALDAARGLVTGLLDDATRAPPATTGGPGRAAG